MVLQGLCHLHGSCAIGICLHHTHQFGLRLQEGAVEVQVIHHRIEVHLQYRLMHFLFQQLCEMVETEDTGTLQKNYLIVQGTEQVTRHELLDTREESLVADSNNLSMPLDRRTNTDQAVDTPFQAQVTDLLIKRCLIHTRLLDITEYQCTASPLIFRTAVHEVEGDIQ